MTTSSDQKPVHTILLDAAPILLNTPSISTLTTTCTTLVTTPAVISEIKGEEARNRFETLYKPFIEVRSPKSESVKFVRDFARKTGDLAVLSGTDVELLALTYDLECERNGGDWRLRNTPGQKRVNGKPPVKENKDDEQTKDTQPTPENDQASEQDAVEIITEDIKELQVEPQDMLEPTSDGTPTNGTQDMDGKTSLEVLEVSEDVPELIAEEDSADSDDGWITPSNIKRKQAKDEGAADTTQEQRTIQVATMTGDFAMQNVLLQINLNLLSTKTCKRISHIKQTILRCHACFQTCRDMSKQFCPRCGKPTLTRVTCTTNDKGEVKLHLKQNFQWNNRGNVYSVPKPTSGTANQKWKGAKSGGGQGGWGNDLILAEDQKEYIRAMSGQKREKKKDLMDEDTLPDILTGARKSGGRVQVGAGRTINSRKR